MFDVKTIKNMVLKVGNTESTGLLTRVSSSVSVFATSVSVFFTEEVRIFRFSRLLSENNRFFREKVKEKGHFW